MLTPFTKMHGLGNDFVVVDNRSGHLPLSPETARRLADRREGVGFDQMLVIETPTMAQADVAFRIFNADGGEVENCGNGARCVAAYVRAHEFTDVNPLTMQLPTRHVTARTLPDGDVSIDMGHPAFAPAEIPFDASQQHVVYTLDLPAGAVELGAVSMGNPHAVTLHEEIDSLDLEAFAVPVQAHARFPAGVNVGAMRIIDRQNLQLRVYERGVGETQACGTGACAAMAVARTWGLVDADVNVRLRGGTLRISWRGVGHPLWMTGPAAFVFTGEVEF
ncbi:MAG: diaminopimelate epimerase [Gammaproteobacteria bacterium]|nr:diaminopimelate epimerase [Gammaproteobacteria bacterium]